MSKLGTLVTDFKKAALDVKNAILKAAGEAPTVVKDAQTLETAIQPVVETLFPGSSKAITVIDNTANKVAQAIEDAGSAAAANGLSVQLNQQEVADWQAVIASAKASPATASSSSGTTTGN